MTGKREEARERTTAQILDIARREIAERGGQGLSMRAVAREVGIVSSAIYRYFPTREALLTAMILESYGRLGSALRAVPGTDSSTDGASRWRALGHAVRDWARERPHEFQLIYGTPIPGYVAPPETVPAAAGVAAPFLACGAGRPVAAFDAVRIGAQMRAALPELAPSGVVAVLAELTAIVGAIGMELSGHYVGTVDSPDDLYGALLERQIDTLGLR